MKCAWTQDRLFDYLDGLLDAATRDRIDTHLSECRECTDVAAALDRPIDSSEDLTQAVLRKTAQAACEQSTQRLPDWIDRTLNPVDTELVAGHLAHCAECRALEGVLRTMEAELPALARIEPDARFLQDVMAATSRKAPALSWVARVDGWFASLIQRPRIAWEGAYLATIFMVLLVGFPGSPLAGVSKKAIELAQTDPSKIEQPFVALEAGLNTAVNEAWFSTRNAARSLAVKASVGSGDVYRKAKRDLGTLWDSIASDPVNEQTQETSTNGESK